MNPAKVLIPYRQFLRQIGVRSPTTGRAMIARGELPQPIKRGRYSYYTSTDQQNYVEKLDATRQVTQMSAAPVIAQPSKTAA